MAIILRYFAEFGRFHGQFRTINQSINQYIYNAPYGTEARATVRIMPKQREMS